MVTSERGGILRAMGPGVLYAAAAVGASHLVQSQLSAHGTKGDDRYSVSAAYGNRPGNLFSTVHKTDSVWRLCRMPRFVV